MTDLEINQFIHEKVFGKCWHYIPEAAISGETECSRCGQPIKFMRENIKGEIKCFLFESGRAHYLTVSAAFDVVRYLRNHWLKQNPDETQYFQIVDCCEHGWRVEIKLGHHDGDIPISSAVDQSLPKAICLAIVEKYK